MYVNSYGKKSQRKIYPLKMMYRAKEWYVKSYCVDKADFRIFKFNRILEIQMYQRNLYQWNIPNRQMSQNEATIKYPFVFQKKWHIVYMMNLRETK